MVELTQLLEMPDLPNEVVQAGLMGELVFFVGSGASILHGLPSWNDLAQSVLEDLREKGFLNYSELEQLLALKDAKKQLSIAERIAEKQKYDLNIQRYLTPASEESGIYQALNSINCPCVTTNYDELLIPYYQNTVDGSGTAVNFDRISDPNDIFAGLLNNSGIVVDLHGSINKPAGMIVTTKDYLEHYDHENIKQFLGELFQTKVVLFVGYGLEEAEILEHILRRGNAGKDLPSRKRFALQGFFQSQKPLYKHLYEYYESSFGVHIVGFERDQNSYKQLEHIIKKWAREIEVNKTPLVKDLDFMDRVLNDG